MRQRRHVPEDKWRIKERERDSGQNQHCWVDKSLVLAIFHYHFSNVSFFCTYIFFNFASVKLLWYESRNHTDIAPEFTVAVAIRDEIFNFDNIC